MDNMQDTEVLPSRRGKQHDVESDRYGGERREERC